MATPRIVIIQREIPHYRIGFFHRLNRANPDMSIEIYFSITKGERKNETDYGFPCKKFPIHSKNIFGYKFVIQPGIIKDIFSNKPDLVVLEGTFGILTNMWILFIRRITQKRTIYWAAGWDNPDIRGIKHQIKSLVIRFLLKMCDGAIVYGSTAREYLLAHHVNPNKVWIAQNTIDVEKIIENQNAWRLKAIEVRKELGITGSRLIVYVGGIEKSKRVDILIDAFALLKKEFSDIGCLIIGNGSMLELLRNKVKNMKLADVHFLGEIIDGLEGFLAAGDVFVLPGTGGLAINQAMALGLPVVVTVADGTQRDLVIHGENGYLVKVDNVDELAESIRLILQEEGKAKKMGERSIQIIQKHATMNKMVNDFSKAIRVAISSKNL